MDKQIIEMLNQIQSTLKEHSKELKTLNTKVDRVEEKMSLTYDEVARIREDVTDISYSVKQLTDKQDVLEGVTANNWNELIKIRNDKKQA